MTTHSAEGVDVAADQITDIVQSGISHTDGSNLSKLSEDGMMIASSELSAVRLWYTHQNWIEAVTENHEKPR